ncbi:MAG: alpha/beta hydrolase [Cyanobacteria bacterium J06627_28]
MLTANIAGVEHAYELIDNRSEAVVAEAPSTGGPTLVFVHGWLLSRAYWKPLIEQISTRYRCLTYDLRGFGDSITPSALSQPELDQPELDQPALGQPTEQPQPPLELPKDRICLLEKEILHTEYNPSAYSLAAYAHDLNSLLKTLNIEQAWVLGHSLGGSIALWAAYLYPKRVAGVFCVNAGGGIYIAKEFEKFRAAGQQMVKFRPAWLQRIPGLPRIFSRIMVKQPLQIRWGQQRLADFIRANRQAAEGALLETTTEAEVHLLPQVMGYIQQPVHFITATEDSIMPPRYVRYLASFHPHFRAGESVTELANCGHMSMVEQPKAVAEVIQTVMQRAR